MVYVCLCFPLIMEHTLEMFQTFLTKSENSNYRNLTKKNLDSLYFLITIGR